MKSQIIGLLSLCLFACDTPSRQATLTGYIELTPRYLVAPESGYLTTLTLHEGDKLKPDTLFGTLDSEREQQVVAQTKAQLRQAEASLADTRKGARTQELEVTESQIAAQRSKTTNAEQEVARLTPLVPRQLASQKSLDDALASLRTERANLAALEAQKRAQALPAREDQISARQAAVDAAREAVQQAEWALERRQLTARQSARVETIYYHEGEFVTQGQPIASLTASAWAKVRFYLDAEALSAIKPGQTISVALQGNEKSTAKISYIASTPVFNPPVLYSEPGSEKLQYLVEATFDNELTLRPGLPVEITL